MTAERPPVIGARSLLLCCHTQALYSDAQINWPGKSWSDVFTPRYRAPQEANCMLQSGPLPQQTRSEIFVGLALAGAWEPALVWATAGSREDESSRTAAQRARICLIVATSCTTSLPCLP